MNGTCKAPKAIIFDFDGTLSTLRCGWEVVMRKLMGEILGEYITMEEIDRFIDESTGIQTIFQMKWIAEQLEKRGIAPLDPWDYKAEYNRRLMLNIEDKKQALLSGACEKETYLMAGSEELLKMIKSHGINIYVASGTDQPDVQAEAAALGLDKYFTEIAYFLHCIRDDAENEIVPMESTMQTIQLVTAEIEAAQTRTMVYLK